MTNTPSLLRGQEITVDIERPGADGEGIGCLEGRAVRVPDTVPGDRVRARVLRPGRDPILTALLAIEAPSPSRVGPACGHFGECGGCAWQDIAYPAQLPLKEAVLRANLPEVPAASIRPILGMDAPWFYRNKMEFTFGTGDGGRETGGSCPGVSFPILGLHRRGRYWDVVDIHDCRLMSPLANEIVAAVRDRARAHAWVPYHKRTHAGEARFLALREGKRTGEWLVNLVSRSDALPGVEALARALAAGFPAIAAFYWTISPEKGDAIKAHRETLVLGKPRIRDILDGIEFLIGPGTFFQTNTAQAERLCQVIADLRQAAGHAPAPVVLDLYCGVGTFALSTARRCPSARVFGVELVPESVAAAQENARRNGIANAEFLAGDVGKRLPEAVQAAGRPDLVIVDPPRAGLAPRVASDLAALAPAQILYVSCNPAALGRDSALLTAQGYSVAAVQPVDMFPHTRHIEAVMSLVRKAAAP
ncbi:MAG: 23S rRNA (uracil(1939)-C(5))-methyltransferase RlmD [Armatimonadetes bacterium]|nr:23S rRNA (uracil(1939)-C(5))-methyltransferase RlmD [Armatimonadota bacterium]